MARTRRRHSYRKSRRWNPEIAPGFAGALAKTPVRPTGYAGTAAAPLVNPRGRSTRSSRARSWNRKVRESVPWWSKGRNPRSGHKKTRSAQARRRSKIRKKTWWSKGRNPRKGSYYSGRTHTRRGRKNPRSGSYYRAKRHLRGLSKGRRKHVVSYALGSMNPRRSRTRRGRR